MFTTPIPRTAYWTLVILLYGVLAFFSFRALTESPPTWFDEGVLLQVAMNDSLHGVEGIQIAPNQFAPATYVTGGFSFLSPISWAFSLFGVGILQARVVMVGFIFLTVSIFFLLIYTLFGRIPALGALLLLVTFPPLYGQGKNVLGEVPGLFYLGVFTYAIHKLEKTEYKSLAWYLIAGVSAGLCIVTKPIFILLGPAFLIAVLLQHRHIQFEWGLIGLGILSFFVPIGIWLVNRFSDADSISAVFGYYANPYAVANIHEQIFTNLSRFFHEVSPAYFLLLLGAWIFAITIRIWKKERISLAEITCLTFTLLISLAYLRTPGWYRYFFLAEIPALVFAPYAILAIANSLFSSRKKLHVIAVSFVMSVLLLLQGYQLLYGSWVAQHGERTTSHDISAYMRTVPATSSFFVYNAPASVIFLPSQNYYQYLELNTAVHLGEKEFAVLASGTPDYIVTSDIVWRNASSSMPGYHFLKDIDSLVIAERN